jgi:hypothetical protein
MSDEDKPKNPFGCAALAGGGCDASRAQREIEERVVPFKLSVRLEQAIVCSTTRGKNTTHVLSGA